MLGCDGMLTDLILAILHHLAIACLIVLLGFEFALLRPGITPENLACVAKAVAVFSRIGAPVATA